MSMTGKREHAQPLEPAEWLGCTLGGKLGLCGRGRRPFVVGYTSPLHLAPAFAGWALWWLALALCRAWLFARGDRIEAETANA